MFKELLSTGVLTTEDFSILSTAIGREEPDFPYASDIRISFASRTGTFYLCDRHGFICSVKSIDHLLTLLAIAREESLRHFLHIEAPSYRSQELDSRPMLERVVEPGISPGLAPPLTPTQVRARALADSMAARRFATPIAGDTRDVTPLADASENDQGFNEAAAIAALNLDGKGDES
jgi:hypothetical protein